MGYAAIFVIPYQSGFNFSMLATVQHSHTLSMTVLMTPDMTNFSGKVHGGAFLRLLDQVAYSCASRYAGHYVVTVSVDRVTFLEPIHVGELVTFHAAVNYTGQSSMEIGIRAVAENIRKRTSRHVTSCFFTMVALNEEGEAVRVTPFVPNSVEEKRRFAAAQIRRQLRQEMDSRAAALMASFVSEDSDHY